MKHVQSLALLLCLTSGAVAQEIPVPVPVAESSSKYFDAIEAHMDYVTENSLDEYGDQRTGMWLATIDLRTNGLPGNPLPRRLRWYRRITSPGGANLYWDQPTIVAAYALARRTGCKCYSDAADVYIREYLDRCVHPTSGLISWGNHRYYDVTRDEVVAFSGGYHECRPHTPAWETLWSIDARTTERAIRAMAKAHLKDPQTGMFCRHANVSVAAGQFTASEVENALPFLEAGAPLIESLCWLAKKIDEPGGDLTQQALQIARYSFQHRHDVTGLVRNQPNQKRWDHDASTTELGLWVGSLLRARQYTGNAEFQQIAEDAMEPWLKFGFDANANKYFGRLSVETAKPQAEPSPRGYVPPRYAELFDLHERPTHSYPLQMAEACLSLYELTRRESFRLACDRWVEQIRASLPANEGRGAYAEDYGRAIHFLVRASEILLQPELRDLAGDVADEAFEQLYVPKMGMFRSHPDEDRCDSVDGPGVLILALLYLDGSDPIVDSAFQF